MPSNYEEYGVLDAKIRDLTNQKDALKVKIIEDERIREQEHGLSSIYNDWRVFFTLHPEQKIQC